MIAVVQRVRAASVTIDGQTVASIGRGLCVLAAIVKEDTDADLKWMTDKLSGLRVFPVDDKAFDLDVKQVGGSMLLISNFTVSAGTKRGRRPSFEPAMPPALASVMFNQFITLMRATGIPIETGRFGADMTIDIQNDGPITLIVDSRE
jgi:D-tyrosyl-tRNA(Tyr) deacylase